jgi:hypothetical protein
VWIHWDLFVLFSLSHFTRYFQNQSLLRSIYFLCNNLIFVLHTTKASIIILSLTMFDVLKWKEKDHIRLQHKNYTKIFIYVTLCFVTNIQKPCTYVILTLCFIGRFFFKYFSASSFLLTKSMLFCNLKIY